MRVRFKICKEQLRIIKFIKFLLTLRTWKYVNFSKEQNDIFFFVSRETISTKIFKMYPSLSNDERSLKIFSARIMLFSIFIKFLPTDVCIKVCEFAMERKDFSLSLSFYFFFFFFPFSKTICTQFLMISPSSSKTINVRLKFSLRQIMLIKLV